MAELCPFSHRKVAWYHWKPHRTERDPLVFICTKKIQNPSRNDLVMAVFPQEVAWFHWKPHGTKGDPLLLICTKKIQNWSRNSWVTAIFPLRGCAISLRIAWDKRRALGVHFNQQDLKSVKKRLSYGHFAPGWLLDYIENHIEQKGILRCSFVPKRSKMGQ